MLSIHEMVKHTLKTIAANTQVFQRVFEHFPKVKTVFHGGELAGISTVIVKSFWKNFTVPSPANNLLFNINNRNNRKRCEICSQLTIKTTERRQRHYFRVFTVSLMLTLDMFHTFLWCFYFRL